MIINHVKSNAGLFIVFSALSCFLINPLDAHAQTEQAGTPADEHLVLGVLAEDGNIGARGPFSIASSGHSPGDKPNIISASIARTTRNKCDIQISNKSKINSYSLTLLIEGYNQRGRKSLTRSFSQTLKPEASAVRTIQCRDYSIAVLLKSGEKLSPKED